MKLLVLTEDRYVTGLSIFNGVVSVHEFVSTGVEVLSVVPDTSTVRKDALATHLDLFSSEGRFDYRLTIRSKLPCALLLL